MLMSMKETNGLECLMSMEATYGLVYLMSMGKKQWSTVCLMYLEETNGPWYV